MFVVAGVVTTSLRQEGNVYIARATPANDLQTNITIELLSEPDRRRTRTTNMKPLSAFIIQPSQEKF